MSAATPSPDAPAGEPPLLRVQDLRTHIVTARNVVKAVDGVSFEVRGGMTLGLVGESGSGKSMTCLSILRLLPPGGRIVAGSVCYRGQDLSRLPERSLRAYRGAHVALIPQDPLTALNPVLSVETQVSAPLRVHGMDAGRRRQRVIELLAMVDLPSPRDLLGRFPHQLSGGMRQRVVAAIALAAGPSLLLADEPTTSLDPTIQLQFLQLLRRLQRERGLGIIFVTHDFGIVERICDEVAVFYAGRIVERGPVARLLEKPQHPYTQGLLAALPERVPEGGRLVSIPGRPPRPGESLPGCPFAPRCPHAMPRCTAEYPPRVATEPGHDVDCWLHVA